MKNALATMSRTCRAVTADVSMVSLGAHLERGNDMARRQNNNGRDGFSTAKSRPLVRANAVRNKAYRQPGRAVNREAALL